MFVLTAAWNNQADDKAVNGALRSIMDQSEQILKRQGKSIPFKYLNYADADQNPIATYGRRNVDNLWRASRKYDPKGLWQGRVPGYKLPKNY